MAHEIHRDPSPHFLRSIIVSLGLVLCLSVASTARPQTTQFGFVPNDVPSNNVTVFDASTHAVIGTITSASINQPRSVAFSPDGHR